MLIKLNNDKARRDFLNNFHAWGLWFHEPHTSVDWYRCQMSDGTVLIAEEGPDVVHESFHGWISHHKRYHMIAPGKAFCLDHTTEGEIMGGVLHELRGDVEIMTAQDIEACS